MCCSSPPQAVGLAFGGERGALVVPAEYGQLLDAVKREIADSRVRAARAVNSELVALYWRIGRLILDRPAGEGWGARVIDRLAADLRAAFPDSRGFSRRNLHYMRALAQAWPDQIVQQPAARLPWGHLMLLLDKLHDPGCSRWTGGTTGPASRPTS